MKVTVVGAGAVGASCAEYIAIKNFVSEVVLLDIKENFAEGKAMDLMQLESFHFIKSLYSSILYPKRNNLHSITVLNNMIKNLFCSQM